MSAKHPPLPAEWPTKNPNGKGLRSEQVLLQPVYEWLLTGGVTGHARQTADRQIYSTTYGGSNNHRCLKMALQVLWADNYPGRNPPFQGIEKAMLHWYAEESKALMAAGGRDETFSGYIQFYVIADLVAILQEWSGPLRKAGAEHLAALRVALARGRRPDGQVLLPCVRGSGPPPHLALAVISALLEDRPPPRTPPRFWVATNDAGTAQMHGCVALRLHQASALEAAINLAPQPKLSHDLQTLSTPTGFAAWFENFRPRPSQEYGYPLVETDGRQTRALWWRLGEVFETYDPGSTRPTWKPVAGNKIGPRLVS